MKKKNFLILMGGVVAITLLSPTAGQAQNATCYSEETRVVQCRDYEGKVIADSFCTAHQEVGQKPITSRECNYRCEVRPLPVREYNPPSAGSHSSNGSASINKIITDIKALFGAAFSFF